MINPDKPEIPIEEFYRSSSLSQLLFDSAGRKQPEGVFTSNKKQRLAMKNDVGGRPKTSNSTMKSMRKTQSHKNLLFQEFNWNEKFHILASKNNIQCHKNYAEYFDAPVEYDVRGYA